MAAQLIVLDSSILIEYFRKKNKERSVFIKIARTQAPLAVSVITRFGFLVGGREKNLPFWEEFFKDFQILPLTTKCVDTAADIQESLRKRNKQLAFPDLLIAATAVANDLPLATLNRRHFGRIENLQLLEPPQ